MDGDITKSERSWYLWRWFALVAIVGNVVYNYLSQAGKTSGNVGTIAEQYNSLFTPAGYAFSIWGLIYLSFFSYAIYALLPSQRFVHYHDQLTPRLGILNILASVWVYVFGKELIGVGLLVITGMLVISLVLFVRAHRIVGRGFASRWQLIPFSLIAGWLSVATIANASLWLITLGWRGGNLGEVGWSQVMICVAAILGIFTTYRFADFIFPLVIVWASVALWAKFQDVYPGVAFTAIIAAAIILANEIVSALLKWRKAAVT